MKELVYKMKKVLIIINNLGCNGAPVYALSVCKILKNHGYQCDVWSLTEGVLRKKFEKELINVKAVKFYDYIDEIERMMKQYSLVICFTIQTYLFYDYIKNLLPTMWYIHEGHNIEEFLKNRKCKEIFLKARNLFVVSEYAQEYLWNTYKKRSKVIHNFVFDVFSQFNKSYDTNHERKRFLIVGSFIERKGYDILFDAYLMMQKEKREKCEIFFCGEQVADSPYVISNLSKIKGEKNIYNYGLLTENEQIYNLYAKSDVVVIPSRDESCSLVALEAAMMGKPIIVSQNVGAKYLLVEQSGWILSQNTPYELALLMEHIIDNNFNLYSMGQQSRSQYLNMATKEEYENNINSVVKSLLCNNNFERKVIYSILHWLKVKYAYYFKSPFLNTSIRYKSRIILYGAGENGKKWKKIFEHSKYYKLVGWVDKYICADEILGIDSIKDINYDYIFISVVNEKVISEILEEFNEIGIAKEKILNEKMFFNVII
ncbi:MAG: glycosyltransferase family 4 protein [Lachnospiraceae bacterium]|nr:glycosyltransferase family 4 protein [Lachnospiraceae bacterium]